MSNNSFGNSLEFTRNNVEGTHLVRIQWMCHATRTGFVKTFARVSTVEMSGASSFDKSEGRAARDGLQRVVRFTVHHHLWEQYPWTLSNPEKAIMKFSILAST
mmetsp:Transcript_6544/g.26279  ORF Transcript_6544/g.26279 Transcript_6544/m.26279 type:complete len:103 (+) Transcript_6544:2011-2319(+)